MAQEIADSTLLDTWASSGLIVEPDISKIIEGWQLGEQPPHEYMNWLQNAFGSKLNHILKNGVASWNNTTQYLAGSSVQHNGNVWLCKTTNTNSAPTDANANWKRIITVESLTTVLGGYVALTGNQTIAGVKTFSSTISGSISGNAGTVTNGVYTTGNQTIAGVKTFSSSPIVPAPITSGNVITMDNIIQKTPVALGYGDGSGGTVTQLTSKSTAVTLNKPSGRITTASDALAAGASVFFTVSNSLLTTGDVVCISWGSTNYEVFALGIGAGIFTIKITNTSVASRSDALPITFSIIKGAIA